MHNLLAISFEAFGFLSLVLCVLPALLGVWSFHHDQRQSLFRFLADRGGSPKSIWLSKQVIWLPLVVMLTGLSGLLFTIGGLHPIILVAFVLVIAVQSFAAGQCLSQLIRSPLTSMFLAAVLSLLLAGWVGVLDQVRAPWPYQLGAAAVLFFASWVHSRDWLEERSTWRAWGRLILAVVPPAAVIVFALEARGYPVWRTIRTFVLTQ